MCFPDHVSLDPPANPRGGTHYPYFADTDMDRHERASNLLEGTQQGPRSLPVSSTPGRVQGGVRDSVLQGIWWDRSLDTWIRFCQSGQGVR